MACLFGGAISVMMRVAVNNRLHVFVPRIVKNKLFQICFSVIFACCVGGRKISSRIPFSQ